MPIPAILQQLGRSQMTPMAAQIKQMMNMVNMAGNPQAMLNQLIMSNPQMKQAMEIVKQYGGDSMKALYGEAERMGVDPQEILNMLK